MKIAILSFYNGLLYRGVEAWTYELAKRLAAFGHHVTVFQAGKKEMSDINYEVVTIPIDINWVMDGSPAWLSFIQLNYWDRLVGLFTLKVIPSLMQDKYDIIHPTSIGWQTPLCRLISLFTGSKVVAVGHAGIGRFDAMKILWRPTVYVAPSQEGLRWAKSLLISRGVQLKYIPHGVDIKRFSPRGKVAAVPLPKPLFLCVSALEPYKRIDLAIRAIAKVGKGSLLVLGDGSEKERIEQLGEKLLGERFSLKSVPYYEISMYYRAADIFTHPCNPTQAFELVILEAMATNLPVVATDDPIRREIVGDAGILVDPTDIEEYAKALEQVLNTNWGNKPRQQAEKFSWDKIAKQYEELFENLIK